MMKPNEIRAGLIIKGITIASIANKLGIKPTNVSFVIAGTRTTPRIQAAVAKAIGKPVEEVFPATSNKEKQV